MKVAICKRGVLEMTHNAHSFGRRIQKGAAFQNGVAVVVTSRPDKNGDLAISSQKIDRQNLPDKRFGVFAPKVYGLAGGGSVFVKIVALPPMPESEIAPTILLTQKDSLPFPADDMSVTSTTLSSSDTHGVKALMAAIRLDEIDKLSRRYKQAGLSLAGLIPGVVAFSSFLKRERIKGTSIVLSVEEEWTGIHIYRDDLPLFTREIPMGYGAVSEKDEPDAQAFEAIAQEVDRSLKSFAATSPGVPIDIGLISAPRFLVDAIVKPTESITGIEFKPFATSIHIAQDLSYDEIDTYCLAPIIGLAIHDDKNVFDLIPTRATRLFMAAQKQTKTIAYMAALVLVTFIFAGGALLVKNLDANIEKLESEVAYLELAKTEYDIASVRLAKLTEENRNLEILYRGYPALSISTHQWRRLFSEVAAAFPANAKLSEWRSVRLFRRENNRSNIYASTFTGQVKGTESLRLEVLGNLLRNLSGSNVFSSIRFVGGKRKKGASDPNEFFEFTIMAESSSDPAKMAAHSYSTNDKLFTP